MMQAGNEGGEDRKDDQIYPETAKLSFSVCDVSSDEFKKTWLKLKELHDKELQCLRAKLTSLRKERLADKRRTASKIKVKELSEQQKALSDTIQALRHKLESKTCERCTVNETYRSSLQQEFNTMQQENLKFIAELTAERDALREENKMLSEKLRLSQQKLSPVSSSDDDFIPCAPGTASVFMVRDPEEEKDVYQPMKFLEQLLGSEEVVSEEEKEEQQNLQLPPIFHSPDLFDMADTSYEILASNTSSKPTTEGSDYQKSPVFPSVSYSFQRGREFKTVSNLSEDKLGQAKEKEMVIDKTPSPVCFPYHSSSIAEEQNPEIQIVSETSEENMPEKPTKSSPFTAGSETGSINLPPLDYTNRKRSIGIPRYNIGGSEIDDNCQIASSKQATQGKNTNESTGVAKPQGSDQSCTLGSRIKRKTRMQSQRRK